MCVEKNRLIERQNNTTESKCDVRGMWKYIDLIQSLRKIDLYKDKRIQQKGNSDVRNKPKLIDLIHALVYVHVESL